MADLTKASPTTMVDLRKDFKGYIKSLIDLTRKISKDEVGYAVFSPALKKHLSSFKTFFGKYKSNEYCSDVTVIYSKLLKCFRKFEPQYAFEFYICWRDMLRSFSSSSRADSFIQHIHKFEFVVEHLESADCRWRQSIVLSILRGYTKKVDYKDLRDLHPDQEFNYLHIIKKIILLPRHQDTSVRSDNAFFSYINTKNGVVSSFQPYKIEFGDEIYIITDYELWIDCNILKKTMTFVASSTTKDKFKTVYGSASTSDLKIVSDRNVLFIQSNWYLDINDDSHIHKSTQNLEIMFHFSPRIHNLILESDLKNVFDFILDKEDNKLKANLEGIKSQADESLLSSINEVNFDEIEIDENEKPQTSAHSEDNRIEIVCEDTTKQAVGQEENNFDRKNEKQVIEEIIKTQSDFVFKSNVNLSENVDKNLLCEKPITELQIENNSQKRKRGEEADDRSSDNQNKKPNGSEEHSQSKRLCTILSRETSFQKPIVNKILKFEPLYVEDVNHRAPFGKAVVETSLQNRVQRNDGKHIQVLAEVILLAANDVIRTLNTHIVSQRAGQKFNESMEQHRVKYLPHASNNEKVDTNGYTFESAKNEFRETRDINANNPQRDVVDLKKRFDENVFKRSWTIRKFIKALRTEHHYDEEIGENETDIEHFDSVSKVVDLRRK